MVEISLRWHGLVERRAGRKNHMSRIRFDIVRAISVRYHGYTCSWHRLRGTRSS